MEKRYEIILGFEVKSRAFSIIEEIENVENFKRE
jgi:hypothetical protein